MIIREEILIPRHASVGKSDQIMDLLEGALLLITLGPPVPVVTPKHLPQILIALPQNKKVL